jgi:hypothetical protein
MIFTAPLALLGLLALPGILLLLRLNPPRARRVAFPPLALLHDLPIEQTTPRGIPLWLVILRLLAAALVVLGLAGPSLHRPPALPGAGPILLVIDNGWAAAPDWQQRQDAASTIIAAAASANRGVALLATAPDDAGAAPRVTGVMTAAAGGQLVDALQPLPWPVDRAAAAIALQAAPETTRIYIADGITDGPGFQQFFESLSPNRILAAATPPALLQAPHLNTDGSLSVRVLNPPPHAVLRAVTADGGVLATTPVSAAGTAAITLPLPLANRVTAFTLAGPPTAGATLLLDGSSHAVLAGLVAGGYSAETPYLGALYFIRRALPLGTQTVTGDLPHLIASKANIIIAADDPLDPPEQAAVRDYIAEGGTLIRFAGPLTSAAPDPVSPDPLLPGDRRLGGALTWTTPQAIAPFPAAAFAGLHSDPAATVSRQILADPTTLIPATIWATLADGTPLVLGTRIGKGYLVSILTTANTDWSNLALSGLFPAMLGRLAGLAQGAPPKPGTLLPLVNTLSAFGKLTPSTGNIAIEARRLITAIVSPTQPPGLYGNGGVTLALNLGDHIPPPVAAPLPHPEPLTGQLPPVDLGPNLIAAAIVLLAIDLTVSLIRRGLLTPPRFAMLLILLLPICAQAQTPALQPTIGYLRTNDPATDQLVGDALSYLSANVSAHTSAQLGAPVSLDPAVDDLSLYPLIYWMVLPDAPAPAPAACTALTSYMQHGGLLVIDTPGGDANAAGSGAGFAPGAAAALAQATGCLALPPLTPLGPTDVLAHCFYIIESFPGRFTGAPVLIATAAARDADGVTPVIVSQNDWAGAWARDSTGAPEQTPIPDGDDQRMIADRFGTNLVIYALTGSYKADQSNVPALLDKLGQ